MMNLKLQNAAQRHNCFHALRDFLERSLRFWIIHEQLIRACLHFGMSQQICISY